MHIDNCAFVHWSFTYNLDFSTDWYFSNSLHCSFSFYSKQLTLFDVQFFICFSVPLTTLSAKLNLLSLVLLFSVYSLSYWNVHLFGKQHAAVFLCLMGSSAVCSNSIPLRCADAQMMCAPLTFFAGCFGWVSSLRCDTRSCVTRLDSWWVVAAVGLLIMGGEGARRRRAAEAHPL